MAKGVEFSEQTATLGPPAGHSEEDVYRLPIQRYVDQSGKPNVLCAFQMSLEERAEFLRTGIVYFSCWGTTLSPMFITAIYPEGNVVHNLYIVENDEHCLKLAKEVKDMKEIWNDLTERQRMEVDAREYAIRAYINNKV